jgi:EAL domain-containing protein (putative c-di-GMP-specific phosphodiesterase class I)/GGDEF domain-containing protein
MTTVGGLKQERDRFVAFSFAAADLLFEVGSDGLIRYVYGAARALTGRDPAELVGQSWGVLFADHDRQLVQRVLQRLDRGARLKPVGVTLAPFRGTSCRMVLGGCRLPDDDGAFYLTLSTAYPATASETVDTSRDRETGLLDQSAFEKRATAALRRESNGDLGLTLVHLDGFDRFSEQAGVDATSSFLTELGALLRACSVDGSSAGRLAGDRYGLIRDEDLDDDLLGEQVQMIADAAAPQVEPPVCARNDIDLAAPNMSEEDAIKALVYTISSYGRTEGSGPFTIESLAGGFEALLKSTITRFKTYRDVIAQNRFALAFQPVVELSSRAVRHHEVLTRLPDDISPYQMVTFAEGMGVIEQFDLVVCRRAMELLSAARSGLPPRFAVNLSAQSLESGLFLNTLFDLLEGVRLQERLLFEITESTRMKNLALANDAIQRLRSRGYQVGLDDFGAGAASFPYLQALTVDFVKIDGAYVRGVLTDPRNALILKSMCSLCRDMGIYTIAEMVETRAQLERLREVGVDCGQGYLFGKPAPQPVASINLPPDPPPPGNVVGALKIKRRGAYSTWN